jgi:DNA-binding sugar fermentation-stimulating protein
VLCGIEIWTINGRNARRITAAEVKLTRNTAGYIWIDYGTNTEIVSSFLDKIQEYRRNWIQHVQ